MTSRSSAFALLTLAAVQAAFAGSTSMPFAPTGVVQVYDPNQASPWVISFSDALQFDANTGLVSLKQSVPSGWQATTIEVMNKDGSIKTAPGYSWHTPERVDPSGPADASNPWKTVLSIYAAGNVDPELSYAVSFKNNTASTQTYNYTFGEAIFPTVAGDYTLWSSISGGLTNFGSGTGASMNPVSGLVQKLSLSTDGGSTFFNGGVDVGPSFTIPASAGTGTKPYGEYDAYTSGVFSLPVNYWKFDVALTLTPGNDSVALTGYAELVQIPEPGTYALLVGCAGLVLALRRRQVLSA